MYCLLYLGIFYHFLLLESKVLIGIDLGSEYMKVAILKPGKPVEIALNSESQRKTPVAISLMNNERLIGEPALSVAARYPENAFLHIPVLLGKTLDSPVVKLYRIRYPYHTIVAGNDGSVEFVTKHKQQFSVEQLSAMLLESAVDTALKFAVVSHELVSKIVITVPPYFDQAERLALLRAAEFAGLMDIQLVNVNSAVALNFGSSQLNRFNATPQLYMVFDMGASSTVVTIASYQAPPVGPPLLRILGVGHDATLGVGSFVDRLSAASAASTNASASARDFVRGRLDSGRIFRVLSANRAAGAITRDQLAAISADVLRQLRLPIEEALKAAGITTGEVTGGVVLMGGGSRCPLVQEELLRITGRSELVKSINTDESATLGAVYLAATTGHRAGARQASGRLPLQLIDVNLYPILLKTNVSSTEEPKALFNRGDAFPQAKLVVLDAKAVSDFSIALECDSLPQTDFHRLPVGNPMLLYAYITKGFDQLVLKHSTGTTSGSQGQPVKRSVEALFRIDDSGLVYLEKLEAVFATTAAGNATREGIEFHAFKSDLRYPSDESGRKSRSLVQEFRQRELSALALARSRNDLEAAVLDIRSRLLPPDGDLARCTGPAERRSLLAAVAAAEQSLTRAAEMTTSGAEFVDAELARLHRALAGASARAAELRNRPGAIEQLERALKAAKVLVSGSGQSGELTLLLKNIENWRTLKLAQLANADLTKDPPVLIADIDKRRAALEHLLNRRSQSPDKASGVSGKAVKSSDSSRVRTKPSKQGSSSKVSKRKRPRLSLDEVEPGDDKDLEYDDDDDYDLGHGHLPDGEL